MRVVIDTNVAVSAVLLPRSVPRQAFDRAMAHGTVLISSATVAELNDVLRRPHFDRYVHEDERLEFLATLVRDAELVIVTEVMTDCRDPNDNKFLELAVSGQASHIVSGDEDLRVLHPFRSVQIVTSQAFLAQAGA
ncbi:MAG: DNA-binding protein [Candidatus Entotheonella factor]|uniref:DNA-binding protein n=1 Tax=Entotheonella factor TaxID=1429438 RepID=W4LD02_ENTF1|nr:putative toxin-antitoxin system toxin component, PIN family [Candidatus Entotheonella palauensis]ETW95605.1 MAG: DNA-binding protein [Candidatus Entotheonella factor]